MWRLQEERFRYELRLRLIEEWRVRAFSQTDPNSCTWVLRFVKLFKLLAKIMSPAADPGIGDGRVAARTSQRLSPDRVFRDFFGSASLLHFADVSKKLSELIGSGKRLALEYRFEGLLLFLSAERMFGQRSHWSARNSTTFPLREYVSLAQSHDWPRYPGLGPFERLR